MLGEYSIEQHTTNIFDTRTKRYFSEVLNCYAAGSYHPSDKRPITTSFLALPALEPK